MGQTHDEITQNLAERLCWEVARGLYRKPLVDGVYRLDEGALLDDFLPCLQAMGVMMWLEEAHGTTLHRQMVPVIHYGLLYGVKTLFGVESINALPRLLFSEEALMQLVGFNAQQVRQGNCQRGATRQGERLPGPMCPDTLAQNIVTWNLRDLAWQCWRRQRLEQTRDKAIVFAQGYYGIFHLAEYSMLLGVRRKDILPEIGSRRQALAK
jgi:hypothetical protein